MRRCRKPIPQLLFGVALLLSAQAAAHARPRLCLPVGGECTAPPERPDAPPGSLGDPRPPAPAQAPDAKLFVVYRSTPDRATVTFKESEGGFWGKVKAIGGVAEDTFNGAVDGIRGKRGPNPNEIGTNQVVEFKFKHDQNISSIFRFAGYKDCKVNAKVKKTSRGAWLEIAKDKQPLDSNSRDNPAVISCRMQQKR